MESFVNGWAGQNAHVVEREVRATNVAEAREANDIAVSGDVGCFDGTDAVV